MNTTPLLNIKGITAGYQGIRVIEPLDLTLVAGERVALVGPNGCGKSTLLSAIAGMAMVNSGKIEFQGISLGNLVTEQRIHHGIGYLMQTRNVFSSLTIRENLEITRVGDGSDFDMRLINLLGHLPMLSAKLDKRAGLLSNGERQALALAMVLTRKVNLLLLDEPIAGLSQKMAREILIAVSSLQAAEGFGMLIVEHRLKLVQPWVDRAVFMAQGRIIEDTRDTSLLTDRIRLEVHYLL